MKPKATSKKVILIVVLFLSTVVEYSRHVQWMGCWFPVEMNMYADDRTVFVPAADDRHTATVSDSFFNRLLIYWGFTRLYRVLPSPPKSHSVI